MGQTYLSVTMMAAATLVLCACYSTSLLQEPANLAPRQARMGVGISYYGGQPNFHSGGIEGQLRVGVTERVELSLKHNGLGGGAGAKVRILDNRPYRLAALTGAQIAAIGDNVSAGGGGGGSGVVRGSHLALLGGYAAAPWLDLMIAPEVQVGVRSIGKNVGFLGLGGHLGLAFHASAHISLIPECSLLYIAAGPSSVIPHSFGEGDLRVQCGLGFSSGSAYER